MFDGHHGGGHHGGGGNDGRDFMMQMGMQYGQKVWSEGERSVSRWLPVGQLKRHFNVSHAYVKTKLRMIFFPFLGKFERMECDFGDGRDRNEVEFYPPVNDVCAPDLYIPSMAIITYITLAAFATGLQNRELNAKELGSTATFSALSVIFQACAVNAWRYIVGLVTTSFLDTLAIFGYAYAPVSVSVLLQCVLLGVDPWMFRIVNSLFGMVYAVFLYRSLNELFRKGQNVPARALPIIYGGCAAQLPLFMYAAARPFA